MNRFSEILITDFLFILLISILHLLRNLLPCHLHRINSSTSRLVTVEGGFPAFGVGSEICAQVVESEAFDYLDAPVERITGADLPTVGFPPHHQSIKEYIS